MVEQTKSGISTRRWISWILYRRSGLENKESGFLFARDNGRKASIGDYDPMFRNLLKQGKNMQPELFTTGVSIGGFSLRRRPQRGSTIEVEKNNVDTAAIKMIKRWRKREVARGTKASLSMQQVYTQVSRAAVAYLRFSRSH